MDDPPGPVSEQKTPRTPGPFQEKDPPIFLALKTFALAGFWSSRLVLAGSPFLYSTKYRTLFVAATAPASDAPVSARQAPAHAIRLVMLQNRIS
jgi:hypothetical protein